MRIILLLLFVLSISASAAATYRMPHDYCPEQACSVQCPAMACAAASPAIAPFASAIGLSTVEIVGDAAPLGTRRMVSTVEEIWIPPD